jgi:(1->4)-alpha-D-glucan 1-alpha-D-glucosylmutase
LRRNQPELSAYGSYEPLIAEEQHSDNVCVFSWHLNGYSAIIAVPRLIAGLLGGELRMPLGKEFWHNTSLLLPAYLQNTVYQDVLTGMTTAPQGGRFQLADVFSHFPVALLISN